MASVATSMAPSRQTQASSGLPSAAPVLEFICLFTHDLKRKQKRWQDGRLKFHTFNKRVMVYDERGNFVGDMHWREDFDFGEGEEISLERGAVIVQVAECVGSKAQDLTELLDKRAREVELRHARCSTVSNSPLPLARFSPVSQVPPSGQFRQRHLADVFNTPRGPQGRAAIPTTSPYEERLATAAAVQASTNDDGNQRRPKRRKRGVSPPSKSGYAQNLFGTALSLTPWSAGASVRSQSLITAMNSSSGPFQASRQPPDTKSPRSRPATTDDSTDASSKIKSCHTTAKRERISAKSSDKPSQTSVASVPEPPKRLAMGLKRNRAKSKTDDTSEDSTEITESRKHLPDSNSIPIAAARTNTKCSPDQMSVAESPVPETCRLEASRIRQAVPSQDHVNNAAAEVHESQVKNSGEANMRTESTTSFLSDMETNVAQVPKAKLRIKARQKRGLLMMINKSTSKKSTSLTDTSKSDICPTQRVLVSQDLLDATRARSKPATESMASLSASVGDGEATADDEPSTDMVDVHGNENHVIPLANDELHEQGPNSTCLLDAEISDVPLQLPKDPRARQKRLSNPETYEEQKVKNSRLGPRLASLGRRSVKSKEIIGSLDNKRDSSSYEVSNHSANPYEERSMPPGTDRADSIEAREEANTARQAAPKPAQAARLINPATRGRKATRRSDAARTVPQSVIPTNSWSTPVKSLSGPGSDLDTRANNEGAVAPGKSVVRLPGFSKANGGPWSKEAFDLLGCTRPS